MTDLNLHLNAAAKHDGRMAMPALTFIALRAALVGLVELAGPDVFNRSARHILKSSPKRYGPSGSGDLAMRTRWDAYWQVRPALIRGLKASGLDTDSDLKDAHIDAALRRLIPASE